MYGDSDKAPRLFLTILIIPNWFTHSGVFEIVNTKSAVCCFLDDSPISAKPIPQGEFQEDTLLCDAINTSRLSFDNLVISP